MSTEAVKFLITADDKATAKFKAAADAVRALEKAQQKLEAEVANLERYEREHIEALNLEILRLRAGADAAEDYELAMKGASTATRLQASALREQIKELEYQQSKSEDGGGLDGYEKAVPHAERLSELTGKISGFVKGMAWGAIVAAVYKLSEYTWDTVTGATEWNAELERTAAISNEVVRSYERRLRASADELNLADNLEKAKAAFADQQQRVNDLQYEYDNRFQFGADRILDAEKEILEEKRRTLDIARSYAEAAEDAAAIEAKRAELVQLQQAQDAEQQRADSIFNMVSGLEDEIAKLQLSNSEYELRQARLIGVNQAEEDTLRLLIEKRDAILAEQQAVKVAEQEKIKAAQAEKQRLDQLQKDRDQYAQSITKEAERLMKAQGQSSPQLQAKESRLLSRSSEMDPQKVVAQTTAQLVEQAKKNIESQQRQEALLRRLVEQKIEVFGKS